MVELVDSADVHPAGVLVHHEVVELRPLLVRQAALVRELGDYVQAATWQEVSIRRRNLYEGQSEKLGGAAFDRGFVLSSNSKAKLFPMEGRFTFA